MGWGEGGLACYAIWGRGGRPTLNRNVFLQPPLPHPPGPLPRRLAGHRLVSLDVTALVAGSAYRGEFEERLQAVLREVSAAARASAPHAHPASPGAAGHTFPHHTGSGGNPGRVMLFIDECHQLLSAGASEGGLSAANILKPALARGELQCIGATTLEEYQRHIEKDPALARRFQVGLCGWCG